MAQFINLIINCRILCNIRITGRHISFRLIVVVIGNKVLYCIFREKLLHLPVQLCRQRLIMRNNECRLLHPLNNICHCKCLARTGNAHQRFKLVSLLKTFRQFLDCLRLVAGRLIF